MLINFLTWAIYVVSISAFKIFNADDNWKLQIANYSYKIFVTYCILRLTKATSDKTSPVSRKAYLRT
jgi:hypothetical protein